MIRNKAEFQESKIKHQQELLKTIVISQEDERKRIGEDLHDEVGNSLSQLRFIIEIFIHNKQPSLDEFTINCKTLIDKVINEVRNISHNLSPTGLLTYGLATTLEDSLQPIVKTGILDISICDHTEGLLNQLNLLESISIYRIIEELIQNTIKHANAKTASLTINADNFHLYFHYQDDGKGLPKNLIEGMGSGNIRSRLSVIGAISDEVIVPGQGFFFRFKLKIK